MRIHPSQLRSQYKVEKNSLFISLGSFFLIAAMGSALSLQLLKYRAHTRQIQNFTASKTAVAVLSKGDRSITLFNTTVKNSGDLDNSALKQAFLREAQKLGEVIYLREDQVGEYPHLSSMSILELKSLLAQKSSEKPEFSQIFVPGQNALYRLSSDGYVTAISPDGSEQVIN